MQYIARNQYKYPRDYLTTFSRKNRHNTKNVVAKMITSKNIYVFKVNSDITTKKRRQVEFYLYAMP